MREPKIKIFVSQRIDKESQMILDNPIYQNIRCGAVFDKRNPKKYKNIIGDNSGKNISTRRNSFNELTIQYWAWKNTNYDYYGLCHYRRFLSFSDNPTNINERSQIVEPCLTQHIIEKHHLGDRSSIKNALLKYDGIIGKSFETKRVWTPKGFTKTVKDHYLSNSGFFDDNVFLIVESIINAKCPKYHSSFKKYLQSDKIIAYNCFILNKEMFNEMCEFQFSILFDFEKRIDDTFYSEYKSRACGFMGEILYATYITYSKSRGCKILEVPIVFIEDTSPKIILKPAFTSGYVPIVTICSNFYVPYLSAMISSLVRFISPKNKYDFIVLSSDMSEQNKFLLFCIANNRKNFSLRFYNPRYETSNINFYVKISAYSKEVYYKLCAPWILSKYNKAIVIDADVIFNKDPAELFNIDLKKKKIAAVKDVVYQGWLNGALPGTFDYSKIQLKLKNPYNYFNSGVLLMNLNAIRKSFSISEIAKECEKEKYKILDQDIFNMMFESDVLFLPFNWNVFISTSPFIDTCLWYAPKDSIKLYNEALSNIYVYHYSNVPKPWNAPNIPFGYVWWFYSRQTPFYEECLFRMCNNRISYPYISKIRRLADKFFPINSKRRKVLKFIMPKKGSKPWNFLRKIYHMFFD